MILRPLYYLSSSRQGAGFRIGLERHREPQQFPCFPLGVRLRETLGDIDPLNKVPF